MASLHEICVFLDDILKLDQFLFIGHGSVSFLSHNDALKTAAGWKPTERGRGTCVRF